MAWSQRRVALAGAVVCALLVAGMAGGLFYQHRQLQDLRERTNGLEQEVANVADRNAEVSSDLGQVQRDLETVATVAREASQAAQDDWLEPEAVSPDQLQAARAEIANLRSCLNRVVQTLNRPPESPSVYVSPC